MRKQKEARPSRPRLFLPNVQHLVVTIAAAKGAHRSRSDPALVGARKIRANSDQKEWVVAGGRRGIECPRKFRIATRVQRHWKRGENRLILLARIANQRALNLIHASPSAGGIPPLQNEPFDLEGNMVGRKIDASPSAGRAPRSGPGVDSRDRIVIGNGDIADDCLPANDIIVVVLRERSYGKQQNEQHCTYFLHWILILSVVLMFETRPGPDRTNCRYQSMKLQKAGRGSFGGVSV